MKKMKYQENYSDFHNETMFNKAARLKKGEKTISVLSDFLGEEISKKKLLDIGCSTGIMSEYYAKFCNKVIGLDIDKKAIDFAQENKKMKNVDYILGDGLILPFEDESFDIITCSHVYEHVPNSNLLMTEIYRVLKDDGVCYFAAGNKLNIIEPHYHLPFLSWVPKPLGSLYLRFLKKGDEYYENLKTFWGLKKLVYQFDIFDYTKKIVLNPKKFSSEDMIKEKSFKHKFAIFLVNFFYWLFPTYIWLLKKK